MGKLTQVWLSDDGMLFETEEEMVQHEARELILTLFKNWSTFIDNLINWRGERIAFENIHEFSVLQVEQAIQYLQNHLEQRPK